MDNRITYSSVDYKRIHDKLTEYEDTGFEPRQIIRMYKSLKNVIRATEAYAEVINYDRFNEKQRERIQDPDVKREFETLILSDFIKSIEQIAKEGLEGGDLSDRP